ncbi:zinc finger protein 62 homolog isoform X2 [Dreissena polymorpha]|uniref:C2H2-type domain-containing protein n=1 Tax=Dreissena polymorpha TaxID=45954 RepID=A0A9D4RC97_DREPO|nr:zinc finger protein 62 homolog isoform X2 [Dreissena polymorpha]KAH3863131.1 hypothetical protein DPMN_026109 [Dreissena polymorpha]
MHDNQWEGQTVYQATSCSKRPNFMRAEMSPMVESSLIETFINELSSSGHEVLVLAAHIEHATFTQKGSRIGSEFFQKHEQILQHFLSFCQGTSQENQTTSIQSNIVVSAQDTELKVQIYHEQHGNEHTCNNKTSDTLVDFVTNTEAEPCFIAEKISMNETTSSGDQTEQLKSKIELLVETALEDIDKREHSIRKNNNRNSLVSQTRLPKKTSKRKLKDNELTMSDLLKSVKNKVKRNKNRNGSENEINSENVLSNVPNIQNKRKQAPKRVNPKAVNKINGSLLSKVIEDEKVKSYSQCIETEDTTFVDFLRSNDDNDNNSASNKPGDANGFSDIQNKPAVSGKMMNCVDICGFAKKVLNLYENWEESAKLTLEKKECVFCDMKLKTVNEINSHLSNHKHAFELNLETCKKCKITLPSGYVRCHPCVKGANNIPKMINCSYKDIRDEAAWLEIGFAQLGGSSDNIVCDACKESFQNVSVYKDHFVQKHIRAFKCRCEENLNSLKEVKDHVEAIHCVSNDDENRCTTCDTDFTTVDELNSHVREFHCKKHVFKCDKCSSWFSCRYLLSEHFCSEQLGFYRCNIDGCNERFKKYRQIQTHKQNAHGSGGHMCSYCGKLYLVGGHLTVHLEWVHGVGEPVNCKVCRLECRGPNVLRSHMLTHSTEKRFSCEICGHSFRRSSGLSKHRKSAHSTQKIIKKKKTCEVCNASFYNASSLQQHIINTKHTTTTQELKTELVRTCRFCGKQYATRDHMIRHEKVHLKKADYSCDVCGKSFIDRSNWRQHKWTHTGKPKCDKCGIVFRSLRKLSDHITELHDSQPDSQNSNLQQASVTSNQSLLTLDAYQMDNPSKYVNFTVSQTSEHQQMDPSKLDQSCPSTSQIQGNDLFASFQRECSNTGMQSVNMDANYFSQALDMQYIGGIPDSVVTSNGEPANQNVQVLESDRIQNYYCDGNFQA